MAEINKKDQKIFLESEAKKGNICRGCGKIGVPLSFANMRSDLIFYSKIIEFLFPDIQVNRTWELKFKLCTECQADLNSSLKFKENIVKTETKYKYIMTAYKTEPGKQTENFTHIVKKLKKDSKLDKAVQVPENIAGQELQESGEEYIVNLVIEQVNIKNEDLNCVNKTDTGNDLLSIETNVVDSKDGNNYKESFNHNIDSTVDHNYCKKLRKQKIFPWPCAYCSMRFITFKKQSAHEKLCCAAVKVQNSSNNELKNPYVCKVCSKSFAILSELRSHENRHQRKSNLCEYCSCMFSRRRNLLRHISNTHKNVQKNYQCHECEETFVKKESLVDHMNKEHVSPKPHDLSPLAPSEAHYCVRCDKAFLSKQYLVRHMQTFHNYMKCDVCKKQFHRFSMLQRHKQKHFQPVKRIVCKYCGVSVAEKRYKYHEKIHLPKQFMCEICSKRFTIMAQLNQHYKMHRRRAEKNLKDDPINQPYRQWTCCDAILESGRAYWSHMNRFHKDQMIKCTKCDRYFTNKNSLYIHELKKHRNTPTYECKVCSTSFKTRKEYRQHSKNEHPDCSKKNKLCCRYCQKVFSNQGNCMRHEKIHTGVKAYKCDQCDKSFTHSIQLRYHQVVHTGEKPYACKYCGNKFSHITTVYKHQKKCVMASVPAVKINIDTAAAVEVDGAYEENVENCKNYVDIVEDVQTSEGDVDEGGDNNAFEIIIYETVNVHK